MEYQVTKNRYGSGVLEVRKSDTDEWVKVLRISNKDDKIIRYSSGVEELGLELNRKGEVLVE